jgi:hypothetical protein
MPAEYDYLPVRAEREEAMAMLRWRDRWLRLPSRIAMLCGLGALSMAGAALPTAGAAAERGQPGPRDLQLRTDAGRIYLAEGGGEFSELSLPGAAHSRLLRLLREHGDAFGQAPVALRPMMLAGAGGNSIHWGVPRASNPPDRGADGAGAAPKKDDQSGGGRPAERSPLPSKPAG